MNYAIATSDKGDKILINLENYSTVKIITSEIITSEN